MSPKPQPIPLADDGLPKVDIIELATAVLHPGAGPRKQTMVSTREVRAMAEAIIGFNGALTEAARLVHLVDALGAAKPLARQIVKSETETSLALLAVRLQDLGYMEEVADAKD
ncbi:MAG: hypothetical protein Q7V31_03590 [Parvibaculum sp.]|uniref:hypothetical protein n=1 Tax=Parvibaculum sp. TaxID=2024848 RepID=UPI0027236E76|nr:hypothetical protein [Parvibaculum sp.]MDO8837985.1 hypothetical protein [Parvibaculum sp.]